MQHQLSKLSASEIVKCLQARQFTVTEVVAACLEQIKHWDPKVHAWAYLNEDMVMKQASQLDAKLNAKQLKEKIGSLFGVPLGIKDVFNTYDMPTQMGSPIWHDFTPGNDARVVHDLRRACAVIMGKTVTAEFAVHAPGPTCNPHNPEYMPGTSSSGSAAATAACMVPAAVGTQTAGSILRPASYCGVYGFKPSFGLIPRTGVLKTTDSLDTIGVLARTPEDVRLLFDTMRVRGRDYPLSTQALSDDTRQQKLAGKPWKIALVYGPKWEYAENYAQEALKQFACTLSKQKGFVVEEVCLPQSFTYAHDVHTTIYDFTLAYYFKEEFKQGTLVSEVMYEIVTRGNLLDVKQYKEALAQQNFLASQLEQFFIADYDILLNLTTGGEAFKGLASEDRPDNCLIWTLCGVPAINLPVFTGPNNLPFGAQIVARRYNDYLLLNFVQELKERAIVGDAVDASICLSQSPEILSKNPLKQAFAISADNNVSAKR